MKTRSIKATPWNYGNGLRLEAGDSVITISKATPSSVERASRMLVENVAGFSATEVYIALMKALRWAGTSLDEED